MILILMGVSGSGKTTVGKVLANDLGWTFVEADDFHLPANVEKMRGGTPLTDEDRRPWLEALRARIDEACGRREHVVLACSALKDEYRDYLEEGCPGGVRYVYLRGSEDLIRRRLEERRGHFMNPNLLASQFEALEPPTGAVAVDVAPPPEVIAAEVRRKLGL
jgi:gluconokinase